MPLDLKFNKFSTVPPIQAVFNFTDIADGTGVNIFNLFRTTDSTGDDFQLTSQTILSADRNRGDTRIGDSEGSFTLDLDDDYDLTPFNSQRTMEGTAIVNMPFVIGSTGSANTRQHYIIVKLKKNSTEISSIQTETISQAAGGQTGIFCMLLNVPRTDFAVGDTLRITVEVWTRIAGNSTVTGMAYGTDPANRASSFEGTSFDLTRTTINIPFKLDL